MRLNIGSYSLLVLNAVIIAFMCQGCTTVPSAEQRMQAGVLTDLHNIHEDLNKINGRQDQLEATNDELRQQVRSLAAAGNSDMEKRFAAVEAKLQAIDVAREADKREMIAKLSQTIADVINGHRGPVERSSAGAASAAGRASAGGTEHIVKAKESLSQIAHECGVTVEALMAANGLKNSNIVRVGQRLIIPR